MLVSSSSLSKHSFPHLLPPNRSQRQVKARARMGGDCAVQVIPMAIGNGGKHVGRGKGHAARNGWR